MRCTAFLLCGVALAIQPVAASTLVVGVRHSRSGVAELTSFVDEVSDPTGENYGQYLTAGAVIAMIHPSAGAIAGAKQWLLGLGLCLPGTLREAHSHDTLSCDTAGTTTVDHLQSTRPETVDFIVATKSTSSFVGKTEGLQWSRQARAQAPAGLHGTPVRQRKFYGIPESERGTNDSNLQMVWGPGTFGANPLELDRFYKAYCTDCNISQLQFDTEHHGTEPGDNFLEGTLDATYITTFGKNVRTLVSNTNTSSSTEEGEGQGEALLLFLNELSTRKKNLPFVLSLSLGSLSSRACGSFCEKLDAIGKADPSTGFSYAQCHSFLQASNERQICLFLDDPQTERINTAFKVLAARGVTTLSASGDGGSHWTFGPFPTGDPLKKFPGVGEALNKIACDFNSDLFPASSPYVLAIGGTAWPDGDPAKQRGWGDRSGASGGGFAMQWPMPEYQKDVVDAYLKAARASPIAAHFPPPSAYNGTGRAYPDVSAFMDDVPLCMNLKTAEPCPNICGGTSASTPTFAGIVSLLNDRRLNAGLPPLGLLNKRVWMVGSTYPGEAFLDVTAGNTSCHCDTGFFASKGWDAMTGWGTPKWDGLVKYFATDDAFLQKQK